MPWFSVYCHMPVFMIVFKSDNKSIIRRVDRSINFIKVRLFLIDGDRYDAIHEEDPFFQHSLHFMLFLRKFGQFDEIELQIFEFLLICVRIQQLDACQVMVRVKLLEIQDADKNHLIQFGIILSPLNLRDVGFRDVI